MSFDSLSFWLFLPLVWAAWRALPFDLAKSAGVLASLFFYGWWSPAYVVLIVFSAAVDYAVARHIERAEDPRRRRALLVLSLATNLGLLGFFKYGPFLAQSTASMFSRPLDPDTFLGWIIPVGISFYTFQTLSYTLDVYRRAQPMCQSFRDFLLYVSFFPQLVAGPIVRASEFLPQLRRRRVLRLVRIEAGIHRIVQGLFLKVVVADNLAPAVGRVFEATGGDPSPGAAWLAVVFFGAQIFADFAGYSGIAIGVAHLLGLRFPENFHAPYIARGLSEFWGRWHVTLSTWLRDYLYISLGGGRGARIRVHFNLLVTMLLGGLWHGASWTFVVWGALHGIGLSIERLLRGDRRSRPALGTHIDRPRSARAVAGRLLAMLVTFVFVHVCWVFFRAQDFETATRILRAMFVWPFEQLAAGEAERLLLAAEWRYLVFLVPVVVMHMAQLGREWFGVKVPPLSRAAATGMMAFGLIVVDRAEAPPFLYFQF